eukprot:scaffold21_cov136-Skeletonema_marinoi.AAC.4
MSGKRTWALSYIAHKLQGAIIKLTPVPLATNTTTTTLLLIGLLVGIGVVAAGDVAAGGAGFDGSISPPEK